MSASVCEVLNLLHAMTWIGKRAKAVRDIGRALSSLAVAAFVAVK